MCCLLQVFVSAESFFCVPDRGSLAVDTTAFLSDSSMELSNAHLGVVSSSLLCVTESSHGHVVRAREGVCARGHALQKSQQTSRTVEWGKWPLSVGKWVTNTRSNLKPSQRPADYRRGYRWLSLGRKVHYTSAQRLCSGLSRPPGGVQLSSVMKPRGFSLFA